MHVATRHGDIRAYFRLFVAYNYLILNNRMCIYDSPLDVVRRAGVDGNDSDVSARR